MEKFKIFIDMLKNDLNVIVENCENEIQGVEKTVKTKELAENYWLGFYDGQLNISNLLIEFIKQYQLEEDDY